MGEILMIVTSMSEKELIENLSKDYSALMRKSDYLDKPYRRNVLKRTVFPYNEVHQWNSPRKNTWLIFISSRNRKEVGNMSRVTFVAYANFPIGIHAFMLTFANGKPFYCVYPPHFFSRYAERAKKDLSGLPLIKEFFKHNPDYVFSEQDGEEYREVYGSAKEGIAMGVLTMEGNILFRTFITYEMTKGEQIELFAQNNEIRKEIHEK